MELNVVAELKVFILTLAGGILSGFLYDVFRIFRRVKKTGQIMTFTQDILYWVLNIVVVFGVIFYANYGRLRWYEFFGIILGVLLYQYALSQFIIKISVTVIHFFQKVLKWILKILIYPFYLIYRLTYRPFRWIKTKISKKISKIELTWGNFCFKIKKGFRNFKNMRGK